MTVTKGKGRNKIAFIRLDAGAISCRSVLELARQLGISHATALGYWVRVLLWAAEHAPDGDVTLVSPAELAAIAGCDIVEREAFGQAFLWACTHAGVLPEWYSISRPLRQATAQRRAVARWLAKRGGGSGAID